MEELNSDFLDENVEELESFDANQEMCGDVGDFFEGNQSIENSVGGTKHSIFENLNDWDSFDIFDSYKFGDKEKDYVKRYYSDDIGKYPVLSIEELDKMLEKYKKLGKKSPEGLKIREKIINSNLRYSYKIAKHMYLGLKEHYKISLDMNDFIQAGNIGLINAVDGYSTSCEGMTFFAYLKPMIVYSIYSYMKINNRFFSGVSVGSPSKFRQFIENFQNKNGREPTDNELKDFCDEHYGNQLGYSSNNFWRYYKYFLVPGTISLDQEINDSMKTGVDDDRIGYSDVFMIDSEEACPYDDNIEIKLKDTILNSSVDGDVDRWVYLDSLKADLKKTLSELDSRELDIIRLFYGFDGGKPQTLDEIGQQLDLTRERVRQIKEKAQKRIKHSDMRNTLKGYLYE